LELVARIYRQAMSRGEHPTRAIEQALNLPRSTACYWLAAARRQGYLGAAESRGRIGEHPTTDQEEDR
jgi:hypothetical protein